jgi:hypothetical protein
MCCRRKICEAHLFARKPIAGTRQPSNVTEMIAYILARSTQRVSVGRASALFAGHKALEDAFSYQWAADFVEELFIEPISQTPHFDSLLGQGWQQPNIAVCGTMRLFDVFSDNRSSGHR